MAKAELTYSNINFVDVASGFCTVRKVTIDTDNAGRPKNDGGRVRVTGTTIRNDGNVKGGKGPIMITIGDPAQFPTDGALTPKGFALIAKGSYGDDNGKKNFNSRSHNEGERTISMQALHVDGSGARWKVVILVQHDDGRVGVIDPDIENEN